MRADWIAARRRAAEIVRRVDAGMTLREAADHFNLSYMRVHQIYTSVRGLRRKSKKRGR